MPKSIKGLAGRKPPEPSADQADIEDWCRRLVPDLQPIVTHLHETDPSDDPGPRVRPQAEQAVLRAGRARLDHRNSRLPRLRECPVLRRRRLRVRAPLGTTDRTRYVKVTSLEEAERPELLQWIEEAGRTPGWT